MATMIHHTLTLSGKRRALQTFTQALAGHGRALDFHRLRPMPPEIAETVDTPEIVSTQAEADALNAEAASGALAALGCPVRAITEAEANRRLASYQATNWYEWALRHWGTQWNACAVRLARLPGAVTYHFDTACCPPDPLAPLIVELAHKYGLKIEWDYQYEAAPGTMETVHSDSVEATP